MNIGQKKAVDIVIEGHNLLLLGSAGTGKSFVINEIAKSLKKIGKNVQITCSTGIACSVYKGVNACTIHQFTGISDGRYGPDCITDVIKNNPKHEHVLKNIYNVDTLIVDECSMISKQVFDSVNNVCKIKDPSRDFGGIQIIFCGDFLQLPPVASPSYGDEGKYCFESDNFKKTFPHRVILTEIVRQSEEQFITAINEVCNGVISLESENFISKLNRHLDVQAGSRTVKLFAKNDLADDYNRKCILEFPGNVYEFKSTDQGLAKKMSTISAPHILWLKVGCPVILLRNLSDKLVNGLQGYVKDIPDDGSGPTVHFPTANMTKRIPKVKFTVYSPRLNTDIAVREQYPLKPAFGLTIHKAQGMTLNRAEVDCRDIFRPGQLGVAMSRVTTSAGLRVINYYPRYIIPPPQTVKDFVNEASQPAFPDLTCCRNSHSKSEDAAPLSFEQVDDSSAQSADIEDIDCENGDDDFDEEFNTVIATIISDEAESVEFEIPEGFDIDSVMQSMLYKKEVTDTHVCINKIIHEVDSHRLITFVKKLFLKLASYITKLTGNKSISNGIPEKNIVSFYRLVHEFSTSAEYRMSCFMLFHGEDFTDNHMIVCYNLIEAVRLFYLKQKVDLMKISSSFITKRHVTDASRARVRYVAGYCLASLRKKFVKIQKSNLCSTSKVGQDMYIEAKWVNYILNILREDEDYLKAHTEEPDSLLDIERKQYASRGLTNVTDRLFKFFVCLTEKSLQLLIHENLMKYGKEIYNKCLEFILNEQPLYEQFANVVVTSCSEQPIVEFDENSDIISVMEKMVWISSKICSIYHELVEKYLMVLLSQFRKDIKSAYRVEKTMAHRKQIKVTKPKQTACESSSNKCKKVTKTSVVHNVPKETDSSDAIVAEPGPSLEPQASMSEEPEPGPSGLQAGSSSDTEDTTDLCHFCFIDKDDEWIQCDSCNSWYHRKCAGLKTAKIWKKFIKEGVSWYCKSCK